MAFNTNKKMTESQKAAIAAECIATVKEDTADAIADAVSEARQTINNELAGLDVGILENRIETAEGRLDGIADVIAAQHSDTWENISKLTASGNAPAAFSIGEQLAEDWTDNRADTNKVYTDVPMNIVHFSDNETDENGNTLKGMFLNWAYTTPFDMPFDAKEALYDVPEGGMTAGTYHFKMLVTRSDWASYANNNNKYFSFTLTEDLPEGYQLVLSGGYDTKNFVGTNIDIYSSPTEFTPIAKAILSEGENGTYLGATGSGDLNHFQRAVLGYNRYMYSAMRQWLNSSAGVGEWWTKQNKWDRAPSQLNTYAGFLSGYSADFITAMKTIKVQVATNTVTDGGITDVMYDKIFLPSLEQMYVNPQAAGKEGAAWEFYKQLAAANGRTGKYAQWGTYAELKSYAINAKTSARNVRLRSAYRDYACHTWSVNSSSVVGSYYAVSAWWARPACFI